MNRMRDGHFSGMCSSVSQRLGMVAELRRRMSSRPGALSKKSWLMAPPVQRGEHRVVKSAGLSYMKEMETCRRASIACFSPYLACCASSLARKRNNRRLPHTLTFPPKCLIRLRVCNPKWTNWCISGRRTIKPTGKLSSVPFRCRIPSPGSRQILLQNIWLSLRETIRQLGMVTWATYPG